MNSTGWEHDERIFDGIVDGIVKHIEDMDLCCQEKYDIHEAAFDFASFTFIDLLGQLSIRIEEMFSELNIGIPSNDCKADMSKKFIHLFEQIIANTDDDELGEYLEYLKDVEES